MVVDNKNVCVIIFINFLVDLLQLYDYYNIIYNKMTNQESRL